MLSIKLPVYNQAGGQAVLIGIPLLGVSDVEVLGAEINERGELIIEVESTIKGATLPQVSPRGEQRVRT